MCLSILKKFSPFRGYSLQLESSNSKNSEQPSETQNKVEDGLVKNDRKNLITEELDFGEVPEEKIENKDSAEREESESSVELI